MKLLKHNNTLLTNTNNESQDFGIGDASVVIEILRNRLYKHKVRTLVQEYISNARDASREVKSKMPVSVTCPTIIEPTFKVRDFGPGISPDRMANVFVKYGASTKRDNNNQVGGFGIGAKSAWSYTDSFNVITYIDGIKREYLAHTGVNNNGRLESLGESKTTEPNGTEIVIAVNPSDISQFKSAIERCLFFWSKTEYKLNNMPETILKQEFKHKTLNNLSLYGALPNIVAPDSYGWNKDIILCIDGIVYNIKDMKRKIPSLDELNDRTVGILVVHVPNGFVEVSANREEVTDSEYTLTQLTTLFDRMITEVHTHLKSLFKDIKEPKKYLEVYLDNVDTFSLNDYTKFKQYEFGRSSLRLLDGSQIGMYDCFFRSGRFYKKPVKSNWRSYKEINLTKLDRLYYHDGSLSLVKLGEKLRKQVNDNGGKPIVLIESVGLDNVFKNTIKDLNAINIDLTQVPKKPKQTKKQKRDSKEICMHYFRGQHWKETKHVKVSDVAETWHYVKHDSLTRSHVEIANYFDIKICGLSESSIKAIKNNSNFKPLQPLLDKHKLKTKEIKSYLSDKVSIHRSIKLLNEIKVTDKLLKEYLKKHNDLIKCESMNLPSFVVNKIMNLKEVKEFEQLVTKFNTHVTKNYRLLNDNYVNDDNKKDLIIYFNAKQKELSNG